MTELKDKILKVMNLIGMCAGDNDLSEKVQKLLRMKLDKIANSAPSGPAIDGFNFHFLTPTIKTEVLIKKPMVPTTKNFRKCSILIL